MMPSLPSAVAPRQRLAQEADGGTPGRDATTGFRFRLRPAHAAALLPALALLALLAAGHASAQVPVKDIASTGPLAHIWIGNELSCQVQRNGDSNYEWYPPDIKDADCGTFIYDGATLYGPNFGAHEHTATPASNVAFQPVAQYGPLGQGTASSPYVVVTVVDAGATGLRITETDRYVVGNDYYVTSVAIHNGGSTTKTVTVWRAGDCYLANSDSSSGWAPAPSVACAQNPNSSPAGRIEEWIPGTSGSKYMEGHFSSAVWNTIFNLKAAFGNTCSDCAGTTQDNGAGLSLVLTIPPGGTASVGNCLNYGATAPAAAACAVSCAMFGDAFAAAVTEIPVGPITVYSEHTGPVLSTATQQYGPTALASTGPNPYLVGDAWASAIDTKASPCESLSRASAAHADGGPALPPQILPLEVRAAEVTADVTCTATQGGLTLQRLRVGNFIATDTSPLPPNTVLISGPVTVILNEQVYTPFAGGAQLEVNAVHVLLPGVLDVKLLSATSAIYGCAGTPPPPPPPPCPLPPEADCG